MTSLHKELVKILAAGEIEVVDLTQVLSPETPVISLPEPFAQTRPFSAVPIASFDEGCPTCYWNNISLGEHTGTHMDMPAHWITGRKHAQGFTDTVPENRFIAAACVIDCVEQVALDENFLLQPEDVQAWEHKHGQIPEGCWVLMRTDWSKRIAATQFLNMKADGPHSPGPSAETIRLLVQRKVNGFGVETVGTDAGQAMNLTPPFPFHDIGLGCDLLGLASLRNLDRLPPTGCILIAAPLKMIRGSGSPVRAFALVNSSFAAT